MYDQLYEYIESFLNVLLCGFRKAHSAQHALFRLIQAWESELDQNGFVGTILMDLLKAYDCLCHDLIIAKLEAYGLDTPSLLFKYDYLRFHKQRTKVGSHYSDWSEIDQGIPQGSILGPLLFNIFINDIFLFVERADICNFADDNTLFTCNKNIDIVIDVLVYDMKNLLNWFKFNSLKPNPGEFQFMILSRNNHSRQQLTMNSKVILESNEVKLLGLIIDNKLTFKGYIDNLCRTAHFKLHALRRIRKYLSLEKAKLLGNSFIESRFNYSSLVWMFCGKTDYLKKEKLQYKGLKIVYNSNES